MLLFFILFIFILLLCFLLKVISKNLNKLSLDNLKQSPELFLRFLDNFYITNIYYTIFCSFCYFFYNIFIILIIRYIFLGYKKDITALNMEYFSLILFINIILGLILLILIKILIELLFYKEVLKLYLHLCQEVNIMTFIINSYLKYSLYNFLGPINLFLYCVSTLKMSPTDDDDDYQEFYYYKYIYEKNFVIFITKICVKYASKFILIRWIFIFLQYICNLMYEHLRWYKFLYFFYLIIFFIIIFYDFIHFKLYYTYYYFFIFCIITFVFKYFNFIESKSLDLDVILSDYFYKNTYDYKIQRNFINNIDLYYYNNMYKKSEQNKALICKNTILDTLIEYTFNDLQNKAIFDKSLTENKKNLKYYYLLITINIILIFIVIYFLFNQTKYLIILDILNIKMPAIILTLPTAFIVFISTKIYVLPKGVTEDSIGYYIYNKNYARIFVLLVILQSIILGIFFYYTNILESL